MKTSITFGDSSVAIDTALAPNLAEPVVSAWLDGFASRPTTVQIHFEHENMATKQLLINSVAAVLKCASPLGTALGVQITSGRTARDAWDHKFQSGATLTAGLQALLHPTVKILATRAVVTGISVTAQVDSPAQLACAAWRLGRLLTAATKLGSRRFYSEKPMTWDTFTQVCITLEIPESVRIVQPRRAA